MIHYEGGLPHQIEAVNACVDVLENAQWEMESKFARIANPLLKRLDLSRLGEVRRRYGLESTPRNKELQKNVFDISMETGTGKTYTYTKMAIELKRRYGLRKFIVLMPSLAIKLQTFDFLTSPSARWHFRTQSDGVEIRAFALESTSTKNSKGYFPLALKEFVEDDSGDLCFLLLNAQMLTSKITMRQSYESKLFDQFSQPFEALRAIRAVCIIDEPHRFREKSKTWKVIEDDLQPQMIFRYGATFGESRDEGFYHLIYRLDSLKAFNENLIKGVVAYTQEFKNHKDETMRLRLRKIEGCEAYLEGSMHRIKQEFVIAEGEDMGKIHEDMRGISCLYVSKNLASMQLSNGQIFRVNELFSPLSYKRELAISMMREAIKKHFELEKELLTQTPRIKPLSLFFIDDIFGYRAKANDEKQDLWIQTSLEEILREELHRALQTTQDEWYEGYLKKSLKNLSGTHGGYFSVDAKNSDEMTEKEVNEILRDKESLLDINNIRRFIFSKWTLKEGWDNPNVFVICKMRGSGSESSKLQEVGRGLRLPMNEYFMRVYDRAFYLHYFVDFNERDFVKNLIGEINERSGGFDRSENKLTESMIVEICKIYNVSEEDVCRRLTEEGIINYSRAFQELGYERMQEIYPQVFDKLIKGKVRSYNQKKPTVRIKKDQYKKLKALWEVINQKAILEYKIQTESEMRQILKAYFQEYKEKLAQSIISIRRDKVLTQGDAQAQHQGDIELMAGGISYAYGEFLNALAQGLKVRIDTLHIVFGELRDEGFDICPYMSEANRIRIKKGFDEYLFHHSVSQASVAYHRIQASVHPTDFTDVNGEPIDELEDGKISHLGMRDESDTSCGKMLNVPPENYLFDGLRFDSCLERSNIIESVDGVLVFTKIPKQSIAIPIPGGGSYSPDFLYVMEGEVGCVIETKGKDEKSLSAQEQNKITFAKKFFQALGEDNIHFHTQFEEEKIKDILQKLIQTHTESET